MKHKTMIAAVLLIAMALCTFVSCDGSMSVGGGANKARMIVIGMDYQNSKAASSLSGTIDDAMETATAFKSVMNAKKIPFTLDMYVQGGYDVRLEVQIVSVSSLGSVLADVRDIIEATKPTDIDIYGNSSTDATIVAMVEDETVARQLKEELEEKYPGSPAKVTADWMSYRDTPHYPSKENIMKAFENTGLKKGDLLIVYYTGHGVLYDTTTRAKLVEILEHYSEMGTITKDQKDAILADVEIYSAECIEKAMVRAFVGDSARFAIGADVKKAIMETNGKEGALVTGPTDRDPFYGELRMQKLYEMASKLPCNVVMIVDACYSGFTSEDSFGGVSFGESFGNFMKNNEYPNVYSISASSPSETSKVTVVKTEEGVYQRHSAFTIEVLQRLGWVHTDKKVSYMPMPSYSLDGHGGYNTETAAVEVHGYMGHVPARQTAQSLFGDIMSSWTYETQTPQANSTVMNIYLIP